MTSRWVLWGFGAAVAVAMAGCETGPAEDNGAPVPPVVGTPSSEALYLAERALDEDRLDDARRLLDRVLLAEPDNAQARLLAAELLLAQGSVAAAAEAFAKLTEVPAVGALALQGRGVALMLAGKAAAGYEALKRAVERDPGLWRAWNALGYHHDRRAQWAQANESYVRALEANPDSALIYNNRGYSMLLQRRFEEAQADLSRALQMNPGFEVARANLRLVFAWQGKYARALSGVAPNAQAETLNNVGYVALLRGDFENAEAFFLRAMEVDPSFNETASRNLAYLDDLRALRREPVPADGVD